MALTIAFTSLDVPRATGSAYPLQVAALARSDRTVREDSTSRCSSIAATAKRGDPVQRPFDPCSVVGTEAADPGDDVGDLVAADRVVIEPSRPVSVAHFRCPAEIEDDLEELRGVLALQPPANAFRQHGVQQPEVVDPDSCGLFGPRLWSYRGGAHGSLRSATSYRGSAHGFPRSATSGSHQHGVYDTVYGSRCPASKGSAYTPYVAALARSDRTVREDSTLRCSSIAATAKRGRIKFTIGGMKISAPIRWKARSSVKRSAISA